MKDTVVFDLDGTLLNTLEDLCDSINFMLTKKGYPTRSLEEVRGFVGNGVKLLVERALPPEKIDETDECLKIFSAHYDLNKANKTAPYAGILDMLHAVKDAGYKTAVVSNKYSAAVKELCDSLFEGTIDVAIGESAAVRPKPSADGVYAALSLLKSVAENAVYVGDSDVDIMTAKNAGLTMIGVTWGFRDRELLESLFAHHIIDTPEELLPLVKTL